MKKKKNCGISKFGIKTQENIFTNHSQWNSHIWYYLTLTENSFNREFYQNFDGADWGQVSKKQ